MIILRLVVVNSVRSIWMLIPIIHGGYPQNFWICIVLDITFLPFTVSTSIIKEYVVLCNCLVTFISVYYLLHIMLRVWHIHYLNLIIFWTQLCGLMLLFLHPKNRFDFLELISKRRVKEKKIQFIIADFTSLVILRVFIQTIYFIML